MAVSVAEFGRLQLLRFAVERPQPGDRFTWREGDVQVVAPEDSQRLPKPQEGGGLGAAPPVTAEGFSQAWHDAVTRNAPLVNKLQDAYTEALRKQVTRAAKNLEDRAHVYSVVTAAGEPTWALPNQDEIYEKLIAEAELKEGTDPWRVKISNTVVHDVAVALGLSFDVTNPLLHDAFKQFGQKITNVAEAQRGKIMGLIQRGYDEGMSVPDTAKLLLNEGGIDSMMRATRIARSEFIGGVNGGSLAMAGTVGVKAKTWLATNDAHTREWHAEADGQTVALNQPFDVDGEAMMFPGDPNGSAENVVNCFPAGTLVAVRDPEKAFRRWYEGPLTSLVMLGGNVLSCTPNHPVLTDSGWKPAGRVVEGDYLVRSRRFQEVVMGDPNVEDMPVPIEKVFDTLSATVQRIAGSDVDFHGDGILDSEIDVQFTNGELGNIAEAALLEPISEKAFATSYLREGPLLADSLVGQLAISHRLLAPSLLPSPLSSAQLDTVTDQAFLDRFSVDSEASGDVVHTLSSEVTLTQVVGVEVLPDWCGHVYNLQSGSEVYLANGVTVHNCRCTLVYGDSMNPPPTPIQTQFGPGSPFAPGGWNPNLAQISENLPGLFPEAAPGGEAAAVVELPKDYLPHGGYGAPDPQVAVREMTKAERNAVISNTSSPTLEYEGVWKGKGARAAVRAGEELSPVQKKFVTNLHDAVAKSTLSEPATVYRGVRGTEGDLIEMLGGEQGDLSSVIGKDFTDKFMPSTTTQEHSAYMFSALEKKSDSVLAVFKIEAPAGTEAAWVPSVDETYAIQKELLLQQNLRYEVTGVSRGTLTSGEDYIRIDTRVVPIPAPAIAEGLPGEVGGEGFATVTDGNESAFSGEVFAKGTPEYETLDYMKIGGYNQSERMRLGKELTEGDKERISVLDKSFGKTTENLTTFRDFQDEASARSALGLSGGDSYESVIGKTVTDQGYPRVTTDPEGAFFGAKPVRIEIKLPEGTDSISFAKQMARSDAEHELMLRRGSGFRITEVTTQAQVDASSMEQVVLRAEYVPAPIEPAPAMAEGFTPGGIEAQPYTLEKTGQAPKWTAKIGDKTIGIPIDKSLGWSEGFMAKRADAIAQELSKLSPQQLDKITQVVTRAGANPEDGLLAEKYGIKTFKSAANYKDGQLTFYNGKFSPGAIQHEAGHAIGASGKLEADLIGVPDAWKIAYQGGPIDAGQWAVAASKDIAEAPTLKLAGEKSSIFTPTPGSIGVTKYGETLINEDWAEAIRLYKSGIQLADGTTVPFADVFPNRAKILDELFGKAEVSPAAPVDELSGAKAVQSVSKSTNLGAYSHSELEVLQNYMKSTGINNYLYAGEELNPVAKDIVEKLDSALVKTPTQDNLITYRGTASWHGTIPEPAEALGKLFQLDGYPSTSLDQKIASKEFGGDVLLRIHVPEGTPAAYMDKVMKLGQPEKELLLPRGMSYRVDAVEQTSFKMGSQQWTYDVTIVPKGELGGKLPLPEVAPKVEQVAVQAETQIPDFGPLAPGKAAGGSTGAKYATSTSGEEYVAKAYSGNTDRVATEALSNKIYQDLGVNVPQGGVGEMGGDRVFAAKVVPGATQESTFSVAQRERLAQDYVSHAYLANWDFVGLEQDNILWNGLEPTYLDQGGTLFYRAQGSIKDFSSTEVKELDSLLKGQAKGFPVSEQDIAQQAAKLGEVLTDAKIDSLVDSADFSPEMAAKVRTALKGRAQYLRDYAEGHGIKLSPEPAPILPPGLPFVPPPAEPAAFLDQFKEPGKVVEMLQKGLTNKDEAKAWFAEHPEFPLPDALKASQADLYTMALKANNEGLITAKEAAQIGEGIKNGALPSGAEVKSAIDSLAKPLPSATEDLITVKAPGGLSVGDTIYSPDGQLLGKTVSYDEKSGYLTYQSPGLGTQHWATLVDPVSVSANDTVSWSTGKIDEVLGKSSGAEPAVKVGEERLEAAPEAATAVPALPPAHDVIQVSHFVDNLSSTQWGAGADEKAMTKYAKYANKLKGDQVLIASKDDAGGVVGLTRYNPEALAPDTLSVNTYLLNEGNREKVLQDVLKQASALGKQKVELVQVGEHEDWLTSLGFKTETDGKSYIANLSDVKLQQPLVQEITPVEKWAAKDFAENLSTHEYAPGTKGVVEKYVKYQAGLKTPRQLLVVRNEQGQIESVLAYVQPTADSTTLEVNAFVLSDAGADKAVTEAAKLAAEEGKPVLAIREAEKGIYDASSKLEALGFKESGKTYGIQLKDLDVQHGGTLTETLSTTEPALSHAEAADWLIEQPPSGNKVELLNKVSSGEIQTQSQLEAAFQEALTSVPQKVPSLEKVATGSKELKEFVDGLPNEKWASSLAGQTEALTEKIPKYGYGKSLYIARNAEGEIEGIFTIDNASYDIGNFLHLRPVVIAPGRAQEVANLAMKQAAEGGKGVLVTGSDGELSQVLTEMGFKADKKTYQSGLKMISTSVKKTAKSLPDVTVSAPKVEALDIGQYGSTVLDGADGLEAFQGSGLTGKGWADGPMWSSAKNGDKLLSVTDAQGDIIGQAKLSEPISEKSKGFLTFSARTAPENSEALEATLRKASEEAAKEGKGLALVYKGQVQKEALEKLGFHAPTDAAHQAAQYAEWRQLTAEEVKKLAQGQKLPAFEVPKVGPKSAEATQAGFKKELLGKAVPAPSWPLKVNEIRGPRGNYAQNLLSKTTDWIDNVRSGVGSALQRYSGSYAYSLNERLRLGRTLSSDDLREVKALDAAMENKIPLPDGFVTWRVQTLDYRISHDIQEFVNAAKAEGGDYMDGLMAWAKTKYKVGMESDTAGQYWSTTVTPEAYGDYDQKMIFEIIPKRGVYMKNKSGIGPEDEFLLPKDARFIVKGIDVAKTKRGSRCIFLQLEQVY